jgi:uncharacterized ubiquitin-like protein YukD
VIVLISFIEYVSQFKKTPEYDLHLSDYISRSVKLFVQFFIQQEKVSAFKTILLKKRNILFEPETLAR